MVGASILITLSFSLFALTGNALAIEDGTREVGPPDEIATGHDPGPITQSSTMAILNPIESVSISDWNVWPDNRHRAYYDPNTGYVNGFLLFDVSSIPDGSTITSLQLLCYLENAYFSPFSNPVVDVYYSADDNWTRANATHGSLSLDILLSDNTAFPAYVPTHNFVLDVSANNWAGDLVDDRIALGFKNQNDYYSYVYFYGAGGDPVGPAPQLTIEYETPTAVESETWGRIKALFD